MNQAFHPNLLNTQEEKIRLLEKTGVDYCFILNFTTELSQLSAHSFMHHILKERYQVNCLIIGYDHRFGHNRSEGFEEYVRYGKEINMEVLQAQACTKQLFTPHCATPTNISSSLIRKLLLQGEVENAAQCLGYSYFLNGTVVRGYQVGKKIGFPTANLKVDNADKLIPCDGVYAVWVTYHGKKYMGMLNIGLRPTLANGNNRSIEVHILHFDANIYEEKLQLSFVKRTRPEIKFNNIESLIEELHKDAVEVEKILCTASSENIQNP